MIIRYTELKLPQSFSVSLFIQVSEVHYMGAYDLHTPRLQKGIYRQFLSLKSWAKG
jgi:hypothetical protein